MPFVLYIVRWHASQRLEDWIGPGWEGAENLTGLMKFAILVYILCVPTNSNVLLTKPNGPFTEQQVVFLRNLIDLASEEVVVHLLKQKCLPNLIICFRCVQRR